MNPSRGRKAMSTQEAINSKISDVQIWNNAAFDNGIESQDSAALQILPSSSFSSSSPSPSKLKEQSLLFSNITDSFKSDYSSKENQTPNTLSTHKSLLKPPKSISKHEKVETEFLEKSRVPEEKNIDSEIQEIEKEINRLSARLEALRLEQLQINVKAKFTEKRYRLIPAKFMEPPKQISKIQDKIEDEASKMGLNSRTPRRGLSMGPSEIMRTARRGISLGPSEIYSATKQRQVISTPTPTPSTGQNRRKSCFWKLGEIDELRVTKERGKSASLSPKSRKAGGAAALKAHAATTIGSKKSSVKKEDAIISSIQPKKLFTDGEKSVPPSTGKKPAKSGRVVASRYNQLGTVPVNYTSGNNSAMKDVRKRSLPQNDKEEGKRADKKRVSLTAKSNAPPEEQKLPTETRVKKKWEIPDLLVLHQSVRDNNVPTSSTPTPVTKLLDAVPRIRNIRCVNDSPRDSGAAKRVAELVGKKSYFKMDSDDGDSQVGDFSHALDKEHSVCQALSFAEEEEPEKEKEMAVELGRGYPKIKTLYSIQESPRDSGPAKRVSELIGRKSIFAQDSDAVALEDGDSVCQALSFADEDDTEN